MSARTLPVAGPALTRVTDALERLDLKPRGPAGRVTARCPAHADNSPSLSVSTRGDGDGVVLHCHAGCAPEDVVTALGLAMPDLFDTARPPLTLAAPPRVTARYRYTDEHDGLLYTVERREPGRDGKRKSFTQVPASGRSGTGAMQGVRLVLYRLPEVLAAVSEGRQVYVLEGEKDADRLAGLGHAATCNPAGAGKWRSEFTEALRGAYVTVIADDDEAGRRHGRKVAQQLEGVAAEVDLVRAATGKDVSEHLDAGQALGDLVPLGAEQGDEAPEPTAVELDLPPTLSALVLRRSDLGSLPQPEPIIEDTLDARTVAVLAGRNSSGKSFLALDWACCIATGRPWQGRPVHLPGRVLYVAAEGAHGLDQRITAWESAWGREVEALDVLPLPVNLFTGARFGELRQLVVDAGYRLVIIDTWARSTVGGQENNNSDSTAAFERVDALRQTGTSVLVVAHTDAGDNKTRGATALDDNADTLYRIKGDPYLLELRREKRKDGPRDDLHQLRLRPVLDSCVLENVRGQDHVLNGRAEELLSAFRECFADTGCSKAELRTVAEQAPATFARSLKSLVEQELLVNTGSDQRPFYKPGPAHA